MTIFITSFLCMGAKEEDKNMQPPVVYDFSEDFKKYWLDGKAEINSYDLLKSRYGELHKGDAVLLFVVEPFLPNQQVKSDGIKTDERPERVMKLVNSQKFFTGVYPYSIMTSSFYPLNKSREGLLKMSLSSQDWCGQVYSQINNRSDHFELQRFSYFQKEGDVNSKLEKGLLEDEIFTQIRLNQEKLPQGEFEIYPTTEYLRLTHKKIKKYSASATLHKAVDSENNVSTYTLKYVELDRQITIRFENEAPYKILGWEETYSEFSGKRLTSTALLRESINLDYWRHHSVSDSSYRKILGFN